MRQKTVPSMDYIWVCSVNFGLPDEERAVFRPSERFHPSWAQGTHKLPGD